MIPTKAYDRSHAKGVKTIGPITYEKHYQEVLRDIQKGIDEGAKLVLCRSPRLSGKRTCLPE